MHVLVTDASGTLGRVLARQLIAAGHSVSGIAARPHAYLDAAVDLVCAPLYGRALQKLADQADAVIHLAPLDDTAPGSAGTTGLVRVAHAAARAGARLIFVSQAAGDPVLYRQAEELVSTSWAPSLTVRIAPPVGRQLDWMVCRTVATLLRAKVSARPMRVVHFDDLVRFLVLALDTDRSGVVDLATPDTTNVVTAWRMLQSVDPRPRLHRVHSWSQLIPEVDVNAAEEWKFEFGWQAVDAIVDTARGLSGRRLGVAGATKSGAQLPLPVEVRPRFESAGELRDAAPDGIEGEFDDRIDPRFPVFSAVSLAPALPGPLTPITLDVQLNGLRTASRMMGQVLALGGVVGDEWGSRAIAAYGHRPYVGLSSNAAAATQLPGWDGEPLVRHAMDDEPQLGDLLPFGPPPLAGGALGSVAKAVVAARSLALTRNLRRDTQAYRAAAEAEHLDAASLSRLPDAGLGARILLLRDRIHQGWILTALSLLGTGVTAAAQHAGAESRVSGIGAIMESGRIPAEIAGLATVLRADPTSHALAREGNLVSIRALSQDTACALDAALARIGHRGPGEAELASSTFSDDPATLLMAAAAVAAADGSPDEPASPRRLATRARELRELAHDTTLWFTHELRITLRELGSRRVAAHLIDVVDDVYYLTCDELVAIPADARLRVKRRRAERERLQTQQPPDVIDGGWAPVDGECPAPRPGPATGADNSVGLLAATAGRPAFQVLQDSRT